MTDGGRGIAPEDLDCCFPGHMGIASMRQRVEMAGGWIKTKNLPGGGTTIEFWLPGA